jgi:hypothetical protein
MHAMRTRYLLLVAPLAALLACSDSSAPDDTSRPPADLNIVGLSDQAPPLYNPEVSFYAVKGEGREARIFFQNDQGGAGRRVPPPPDRCPDAAGPSRRQSDRRG